MLKRGKQALEACLTMLDIAIEDQKPDEMDEKEVRQRIVDTFGDIKVKISNLEKLKDWEGHGEELLELRRLLTKADQEADECHASLDK